MPRIAWLPQRQPASGSTSCWVRASTPSPADRRWLARSTSSRSITRATQNWKRAALAAADLDVPPGVAFIAAGLGTGVLADALANGGFDFGRPAVISWLGVIMYLDRATVGQTLSALAACAPGTELIADYMLPAGLRDATGDQYVELIGPAAAQRGEPWQSFFAPDEMAALLAEHGFECEGNIGQLDTVPRKMWHRADSLRPIELSMIVRARRSR